MSKIRSGECGVLLLCYSVREDWRKQLITEFRRACPHGRIVAMTNCPIAEPPKETDGLVYGIDGPDALIAKVAGKRAA